MKAGVAFDRPSYLFYDGPAKTIRSPRDAAMDFRNRKKSEERDMTKCDCCCECGDCLSAEKEGPLHCPRCGKPLSGKNLEQHSLNRNLSDSTIGATFEVMAEEGAIGSGAR